MRPPSTESGKGGDELSFDVIVVGSGAAGMTAAITARKHGLDVLIVEKEPYFGGTSARSGGWLWIPGNPLAQREGVPDTRAAAQAYLAHEAGRFGDPERIAAFLAAGPEMVDFLERETEAKFFLAREFADYHPDSPGGAQGGRSIGTEAYDGRQLGTEIRRLRPPLREISFLGMTIGSGTEIRHFFNASRSLRSAAYVTRRLLLYARDLALHGRGMRLTNGNALIGRLACSAFRAGIPLWTSTPATELVTEQGAVVGVVVDREGRSLRLNARRGVVLAAGGFSHDVDRAKTLFAHAAAGHGHRSLAAPGATGDGLRLGESVGGLFDAQLANAAAWAPVSCLRRRDGSTGWFPHFVDRAKPGVIAVLRNGDRFVNESNSYHDFVQGMVQACAGAEEIAAYLICDHSTIRRYGLGFAKPFPVPIRHLVKSGYLIRGDTLDEVAARSGIEAAGLNATVARYNRHARAGEDPEFGKGSTAYNRFLGDPEHSPNPCIAPIEKGPFYIVRVVPADIGTYAGLRTDHDARVLDSSGRPIAGLFAAGNDSSSVMGGNYPGGGITLGPAMTFGYIAGKHLAAAL